MIDSTNGKVFTDQKMFLFKKWFDREIPLTNANVFLPDSGGALLEGINVSSTDKIPKPDKSKKIEFNKNINKLLKINRNIKPENINNKINLIIKHSKDIKKISQKIFYLIPENGKVKTGTHSIIDNLEKKLFENNDRAEIVRAISASAQDILLSIMENIKYNDNKVVSAWIKTRILYESIIKLCDF